MAGLQFVPPHPIALRTIAQGPPYRKSDEGVSGVPRYFVEFTNGPHTLADTEGVELADLRAARECAIEDARFLIERARPPGWRRWRVEVLDEGGLILLTIPFSEIWEDRGGNGIQAASP